MISQVLANAGHVFEQRNAHLFEMVGRADAGQHQDMRRADRPGAENDFRALNRKPVAAACDLHPDGTVPVEQEAMHQTVRPDAQVQAMPRRVQVAERRAEPDAVGVVERYWANPYGIRVIEILRVWEAQMFSDPAVLAFFEREGVAFTNWKEIMQRFDEKNPPASAGK